MGYVVTDANTLFLYSPYMVYGLTDANTLFSLKVRTWIMVWQTTIHFYHKKFQHVL